MQRKGRKINSRSLLETLQLRRLKAVHPPGFTQTFEYVENAPGVQLSGLDISADDPTENLTATLTLSDPAAGTLQSLGGSGGGQFNANTGVWSITGNAYAISFAL